MRHGTSETVDESRCGEPHIRDRGRPLADGGETPAEKSGTDGSTAGDAELRCPDCGASLVADDNFCFSCGADVADLQPDGELSSCPACEATVEPDDSFCPLCGENLDDHRPSNGTSSGRADTGESAGDAGQQEPGRVEGDEPSITLVVRNSEIQVSDGDTVGREVRHAILDAGGDEDAAVRIHREHVRFERDAESDQFSMVDLGENPTVLNGESLQKGDRVPVSPGDRIELSNVAEIRVQDDR